MPPSGRRSSGPNPLTSSPPAEPHTGNARKLPQGSDSLVATATSGHPGHSGSTSTTAQPHLGPP
eukprot:3382899-Prorocentrum_lima.AAC.1